MAVSDNSTAPLSEHTIGQDNIRVLGLDIHHPVFPVSALTIIAFVVFALIFQVEAEGFFSGIRSWITINLDWLFVIAANFFLLFCLFLIVSPLGKIRIGGSDATTDYSYPSWFAMMFAAGVGIGLMFYGVLEPVNHSLFPPLGIEPGSAEADKVGVAGAIFHWGLHAWAIYSVLGLSLAIFHFNKGLPLTVRAAFYPLLGERTWGWPGHIIDILAVFATLFGLATSLGLGAKQVSAGLNYLFGIANDDTTKVIVIMGITAIALFSVIRGMDKGVKLLSEINITMAMVLLLFVLMIGPTLHLLGAAVSSTVDYVRYLPALSGWLGRDDTHFYHDWTIFYWAWWIAWSPFVGMFIARVSRGRTVREFLACSLLVPSSVCLIWMSVFGGSAIEQHAQDGYTGVISAVRDFNIEMSLFRFLEVLPMSDLTSIVALVLIVVFFVTSMDSGSLVIDTITAGGKMNAPVAQRIFWCTFEGLVAIALMLGGGLVALQAASLVTGLPFLFVLLVMCASLIKGLASEPG